MFNQTQKVLQWVLSFDGKNDLVDLGNKPEFQVKRDLTLEFWVYIEKMEARRAFFSNFADVDDTDPKQRSGYCVVTYGHHYSFYLASAADTLARSSSPEYSALVNQWHHVAGTYDGKAMKLYINGVQVSYTSVEAPEISYILGNSLRIGVHKDENENKHFQGKIAEVRLWEVARTTEEIQQNIHQRLTGNESGLVGYWPLNEGSGTVVSDKSPNANHGTIEGKAAWQEQAFALAPAPKPVTLNTKMGAGETALQDYGYWYRWVQSLPESTSSKPFRRGRIWV